MKSQKLINEVEQTEISDLLTALSETLQKALNRQSPTSSRSTDTNDTEKHLPSTENSDIRSFNVGNSDYSRHNIQPWDIWREYNLNPWDADIVKRILRSKGTTPEEKLNNRRDDYLKIIHICQERLSQLNDL